MQKGENNREGKEKDIYIMTVKGEKKLKRSKEKVSRWVEERRGEEE